jgi:hypothetical protein
LGDYILVTHSHSITRSTFELKLGAYIVIGMGGKLKPAQNGLLCFGICRVTVLVRTSAVDRFPIHHFDIASAP